MKPLLIPFFKRLFILMVISILLVIGMSEVVYRLQRNEDSREPKIVELVIPAGTSDLIATGQIVSLIPNEMVFITGDKLVVKNEDTTDHEMGPLWIPAGTSAQMVLDQADDYSYLCSFESSRYVGLTVKQPVTWKSRLEALWYGVPATLMFLLVYSFAVYPLKPKFDKTSDAT